MNIVYFSTPNYIGELDNSGKEILVEPVIRRLFISFLIKSSIRDIKIQDVFGYKIYPFRNQSQNLIYILVDTTEMSPNQFFKNDDETSTTNLTNPHSYATFPNGEHNDICKEEDVQISPRFAFFKSSSAFSFVSNQTGICLHELETMSSNYFNRTPDRETVMRNPADMLFVHYFGNSFVIFMFNGSSTFVDSIETTSRQELSLIHKEENGSSFHNLDLRF